MKHYKKTISWAIFIILVIFGIFFISKNSFLYASSPNLVLNPSVETSSSNPTIPQNWQKGGTGTNTRILTYPVAGYDGVKAVKTEITSYTNGDAKWYFADIPVTPGETYNFSDMYDSNTVSYVTFRYKLTNNTYQYPDLQKNIPATSGFTLFQKNFTVPTNYSAPVESVTMFHLIKSVGAITTDNFSLKYVDTHPPVISSNTLFFNPVSGTVLLSAIATDNIGVTHVDFYIDSNLVGTSTTPNPTEYNFDTTTISDGTHSFTATAYDEALNSTTSSPVTFQVQNGPPLGTITVINNVINDNGGTNTISNFVLFIDATDVSSGQALSVSNGVHTVSEITDSNYTRTISGDCDVNGYVTVVAGDTKTCTITNDDIAPAPPVPIQNFVPNNSVESVSSNPTIPQNWQKGGTGTNTRILTYPVAGYDGVKAVKTEITSYTNGDAKWYFIAVPASSGQKYTFSDYSIASTTSYVSMQYKLADNTYKYQDIAMNIPAHASWTKTTANFTIPTYSSPVVSMTVFHLIKSVGYITVDNYFLTTYVPPAPDPLNLIINPSVETASTSNPNLPQGWTGNSSSGINATFTYPVAGQDGSKAVRIDASSYTNGAGAKWYFQSVPVSPGEEYRFSDYYKGTANSFVTVQAHLVAGGYTYIDLMKLTPSASWKKAEDTFLIPAGVDSIVIYHILKEVGSLTTDNYKLVKLTNGSFATGMVTLNFDDGPSSVYYNAIPILTAANVKSSHFIITEDRYTDPDFMSIAQVLSINNNGVGNEIGSHTRNHLHLTQLTPAELDYEILGSKQDLASIGATPNSFFVYPFGDYNDVVKQKVIDAGYIGARTVHSGYNTKNSDKFALRDQHVEINTTPAQIISYIDTAMATNTWLILEFHETDYSGDQYSNTPETLQAVVDYIVANNIPIVSSGQAIAQMNP
jgi:peptidoglycan/xylan/chitin deacetylase (PgdA/CDA1 family)